MTKLASKIIIFDFDDTLFETIRFKREIEKIFARHKVPKYLFLKTYELSRNGEQFWQPTRQLAILKQKIAGLKTDIILSQINSLFKKARDFLFPDAIPFLKQASFWAKKKNLKLYLVTFGQPAVQKAKIKNSQIGKFFDKIIMAKGPTKEKEIAKLCQSEKNKTIIFIEDRGMAIDAVKKSSPQVITIQMTRPTGRFDQDKCLLTNFKVTNLKQVGKILNI